MTYRLEISFIGDAPDGEYERAKIIAHPKVEAAIEALAAELKAAGLQHEVTARTIRSTPNRKNSGRKPKLVEPAAAE